MSVGYLKGIPLVMFVSVLILLYHFVHLEKYSRKETKIWDFAMKVF